MLREVLIGDRECKALNTGESGDEPELNDIRLEVGEGTSTSIGAEGGVEEWKESGGRVLVVSSST